MSSGDFLLFAAFAYGLAFGIQFKAIPAVLHTFGLDIGQARGERSESMFARWLQGLGACAYCSGFWGGVAWGAAPYLPDLLVYGIAGAGICFAIDRWTA